MADTTVVETAPVAPSNEPSTPPAPITDNSGQADVEAAKRAQQAEMRANQLQNELDKIKAAQDATQRKQLEENEQFKALWEKSEAEKQALISEREAADRKAELEATTNDLLKGYSPTVQELARTAGLSLTDDSDTAQADLKAKLDTFASKIGSPRVEPNNPGPTPAPTNNREEQIKVMRMNNVPTTVRTDATKAAIRSLESIKAMQDAAGLVRE